jgi:Xaa-Pro dipeptidase
MMSPDSTLPAAHYQAHHDQLCALFERALERAQCDIVLIPSGAERFQVFDDRPYTFAPNPHFKYWLPLTDLPHCWIVFARGKKPMLIYFQPADYWHVAPVAPSGYWVEHFDIRIITQLEESTQHLPKLNANARIAILGENNAGIAGYEPNNPSALLNYLDFHRGRKTAYEISLMQLAQQRAVLGHRAAEAAFRADASEYEIHMAYLKATGHTERELPYTNIIGLNQHAAVLHYQHQRRDKPLQHLSFLIDAGASYSGYAADITRTYAKHTGVFHSMIDALDTAQLKLCDQARAGNTNSQIHLAAHREVAQILSDFKLVRMSPEAIVESGLSHTFFPHGIGHFLGLQVHDVGGYFKDDHGTLEPKPQGHRYLRLTRAFQGGEVLTIEPGIYFIDLLLQEAAAGPHAGAIAWTEIEALKHYGGIRIEDNVHIQAEGAPANLTRIAFAA